MRLVDYVINSESVIKLWMNPIYNVALSYFCQSAPVAPPVASRLVFSLRVPLPFPGTNINERTDTPDQ